MTQQKKMHLLYILNDKEIIKFMRSPEGLYYYNMPTSYLECVAKSNGNKHQLLQQWQRIMGTIQPNSLKEQRNLMTYIMLLVLHPSKTLRKSSKSMPLKTSAQA